MGACFICFGIIDQFDNPKTVLHVALFLRFVQGTAVAMSYTTIYAIITNKYPNKKEALLGMLEASFGVGLICGPLAGASLYNMFGFERTFYIYGAFFLLCTFLLWYLIPELEFETRPSIETGGSGSSVVVNRRRGERRQDNGQNSGDEREDQDTSAISDIDGEE